MPRTGAYSRSPVAANEALKQFTTAGAPLALPLAQPQAGVRGCAGRLKVCVQAAAEAAPAVGSCSWIVLTVRQSVVNDELHNPLTRRSRSPQCRNGHCARILLSKQGISSALGVVDTHTKSYAHRLGCSISDTALTLIPDGSLTYSPIHSLSRSFRCSTSLLACLSLRAWHRLVTSRQKRRRIPLPVDNYRAIVALLTVTYSRSSSLFQAPRQQEQETRRTWAGVLSENGYPQCCDEPLRLLYWRAAVTATVMFSCYG